MAENRKKKTSENSKPSKKKTQPKGIWDRMKHTVHLMRTSTRFRHGSMATVMTVIFFVFIVLLNMAVMKMKDRYSFMSIDMTDDKRYTLTADTEKLIKGIDERVEIDILATEAQCTTAGSLTTDTYGQIPIAHEIIRRYPQLNDNISINYVDLSKMPAYIMQFPEYSDVLDYYYIVVKSARRTRITSFFEMLPSLSSDYSSFDSTTGNNSVAQSYTETYMTSLIKTVTLDKTPVVAFVDGLNVDANSSEFTSILEMNGYEMRTVDIRRDELPEDADIVMLAGPTADLSKAQTAKFDEFLGNRNKSRTLIVFSSSLMTEMPNLNSLLSEYGISITQNIVYEGDSHNTISKQMSAFTAQMKESEYTLDLIDRLNYPAVVNAVALDVLYSERGDTNVTTVLTSSEEGLICNSAKKFDRSKYSEADEATRVVMASSTTYRDRMDGGEVRTDVIVAPDSLYASELLTTDIYGNLSLLLNIFNQRGGIDSGNIDIEPKALYAVDFSVDMNTLSVISAIFGYVIPLAILLCGLVVYIRRRRL